MLSLGVGHWLPLLLDIALKSALVSALALAALAALRRAPAATRHLALLAGLGVLLGLPALMALLPRQALPLTAGVSGGFTGSVTESTGLNPRSLKVQAPAFAGEDFKNTPLPAQAGSRFTEARGFSPVEPVAEPVTTQSLPAPTPPVRPAWLALAWLLGALACAGRTLAAQARVWRLTRRCPSLPLTAPEAAGATLKGGPAGTPPMVWDWPRATLLLPPEAAVWPATRLRAVLLHEAAHVQRQDWLTQTLTQAARADAAPGAQGPGRSATHSTHSASHSDRSSPHDAPHHPQAHATESGRIHCAGRRPDTARPDGDNAFALQIHLARLGGAQEITVRRTLKKGETLVLVNPLPARPAAKGHYSLLFVTPTGVAGPDPAQQ